MRRRSYRTLPSLVTGYPLITRGHYFSVILPVARTNLVTNPSLETNTTNWNESTGGGIVNRDATVQYHGAYSMSFVTAGVGYVAVALTSGTVYAGSVRFKSDRVGASYNVGFYTSADVALTTYRFRATGRWQWVWVFWKETSTANRHFGIAAVNGADGTFWMDGAQVEACAAGQVFPTTYIDGDQQGLVPNQFPPAYLWNGTPHASTSTRSGQTRAGGRLVRLDLYGLLLMAVVGLGLPTPNNIALPYAQLDGAQYERTQKPTRNFTLANRVQSRTPSQLDRLRSDLSQVVDRDYSGQQQPLILRYQKMDECGAAISDEGDIICAYAGGLEGQFDNHHGEDLSLVFQQYLPTIVGTGESGAALSVQTAVANANGMVLRSAAGVWSAVGTGAAGGNVYAIVRGLNGVYCIGGDFTSFGGVANTAGIAQYNPTTGVISALGTGATAGNKVNGLAVAPNGDIWAIGNFLNMGGVAAADYVGRWDGAAWNGVGVPTAIPATAQPMVPIFDSAGNFYYGTHTNSTIRKWNGSAWSTLGTVAGSGAAAVTLALAPDGSIVVGGAFTSVDGVGALDVARFDTAWHALGAGTGSVFALAYDTAGFLYAGIGSSVSALERFNGVAWSSQDAINDGGLTATIYAIARLIDGRVIVGGTFTTANGVTFPDRMGIWNGSVLVPLDIDLPGSPTIYALRVFPDGVIAVGYNTTGTATGAATTTVTNTGTAKAYPTLVIKGPSSGTSRIFQIVNTTTGRAIYLNLTLNAGETATLIFDPANLSFASDFQPDIASKILPGSNTADFFLQPGANVISFLAAGSTVTAALQWHNQYSSLADLTP